jgi:hypothetical protein
MPFRLASWRPVHLVVAWCAYWVALALWGLGPALPTMWRITRPGEHGSVSASVENGVARLTLVHDAATVWVGEAAPGALALWVAVPPLLLWALWLRAQRRAATAPAASDRRPVA